MASARMAALLLLTLAAASFAGINISFYYGQGCNHSAATFNQLIRLSRTYNMTVEGREVYNVKDNMGEMLAVYRRFGIDPSSGGVPTSVVGNRTLVIGEASNATWREIFNYCLAGECPDKVYNEKSFSPIDRQAGARAMAAVIGLAAALALFAFYIYPRLGAWHARQK